MKLNRRKFLGTTIGAGCLTTIGGREYFPIHYDASNVSRGNGNRKIPTGSVNWDFGCGLYTGEVLLAIGNSVLTSAFGRSIALYASCKERIPTLYFAMSTMGNMFMDDAVATISGVPAGNIRANKIDRYCFPLQANEQGQVELAREQIRNSPLIVKKSSGLSPKLIRPQIIDHCLVIIDDLFHMVGDSGDWLEDSERSEAQSILNDLKRIAVDKQTAIIICWEPEFPMQWNAVLERRLKYTIRFFREALGSVDTLIFLESEEAGDSDIIADYFNFAERGHGRDLFYWNPVISKLAPYSEKFISEK